MRFSFPFIALLGLVACSPSITPTSNQQASSIPVAASGPVLSGSYIHPVTIAINESCVNADYHHGTSLTITATCPELGRVEVAPGVEAVLLPKVKQLASTGADANFEVYLAFYDHGAKLPVPPLSFPSFADANASWFGLHISYLDQNNIYLSDSGAHEGYPAHYVFNGTAWKKFVPWDLVSQVFPDSIAPPFSVAVSKDTLKITEENYCCDTIYADTPDRKAYRMVYIVNRVSGKILETTKILR